MKKKTIIDKKNFNCICCMEHNWKSKHYLPSFIFKEDAYIYECQTCTGGATYPLPTLKDNHYADNECYSEMFTKNSSLYSDMATNLLETLNRKIALKGKTLLDIGCGGGFLVQVATEKKMIAKGLEANKSMVTWGKERGLNVTQETAEQLTQKGERFDVVVVSAILEHLEDPNELLTICRSLLKDSGVLLVSQADFSGLLPRFFPWGWYGWQPEEHYWHFTISSFEKLAKRSGYKIFHTERYSLHHEWHFKGGLKVVLGRNIATFIAKIASFLGKEDGFNMLLIK